MSKESPKAKVKRKSIVGGSPRLDSFFKKPAPETTSIEAVINIDDDDDDPHEKEIVEFVELERPKKRAKTAEVIIDDDDDSAPVETNPFPVTDANSSIFNILKPKKGSFCLTASRA
jgi:hypothetical protein